MVKSGQTGSQTAVTGIQRCQSKNFIKSISNKISWNIVICQFWKKIICAIKMNKPKINKFKKSIYYI